MYELKVQNPKDKNVWIQAIRTAVLDCPSDDSETEDYMTADQKQKIIDAKQANIREIICKYKSSRFFVVLSIVSFCWLFIHIHKQIDVKN